MIRIDAKKLGEHVDKCNRWWNNGSDSITVGDILDINCEKKLSDYGIVFSEIKRGEEILKDIFDKLKENKVEMVETAVFALNSIYGTQIYNVTHFAIELRRHIKDDCKGKTLISRIMEAESADDKAACVDEIASLVKREGYNFAYSFATKFCSRLAPEKYPIFDSHVATLLNGYINNNEISASRFGEYMTFIKEYDEFIKANSLDGFSYKQIDMFLWTYGKTANNYYGKHFKKAEVQYKPPKQENT